MKMTIGKKLTSSFLGLAALVLLSGIIGIYILRQVTYSTDIVGKAKAPTQTVVVNAALTLEKIQKYTVEFANSTTDLDRIETKINDAFDELDMWTSMLKYGTESKEFQQSKFGRLYKEKGISVIIPKDSREMQKATEDITKKSASLKADISDLVRAHKEYASYAVITKDKKIYPLPSFLNLTQRLQTEWNQKLKDAANMEAVFPGETNPKAGLLGEWLSSYKVNNKELMELVQRLAVQIAKIRSVAVQMNQKSSGTDKTRMFNRTVLTTSKIERYFSSLHTLAETLYNNLETTERVKKKAMALSANEIENDLNSLIANAAKEMKAALHSSESTQKSGTTTLIFLTLAAVIIAVVMGTLMSRYFSRNILALAEATKEIARGDLKKRVKTNSTDELGELASDTNKMIDNLREMIGQIRNHSENLSSSATDLGSVSNDLDKNSAELGNKSAEAASATEKMTSSIRDISTIANDSMEKVQNVSLATEEMSSTINEIAQNTEQARTVTAKAVTTVENTTMKMTELSEAAKEVGKVAEVIVNIADQTNLLSLNATIEAARAGEAGKGFAVVANEVKELASQTNKATEDIRQKITAIQQSSDMTITAIEEISQVINNINSIVVVIAGAVEEQAVTTTQIAHDIGSVSSGIEEMNRNVTSTTEIAQIVSADIKVVDQTSSQVQNGSTQIKNSAENLSRLAGELKTLVGKFSL